jgi:uncharacterized membrane protein YjfL (UPF0719 family)
MADLGFLPLYLGVLPLAVYWYVSLGRVTTMASSHLDRLPLYLAPPLCLLVMPPCMLDRAWGYRAGLPPVLICSASGMTLVFAASLFFPFLGISPRDDVAERRNRAAGWAVAGAQFGLALAFALAAGSAPPGSRLPEALGAGAMVVLIVVWVVYEKRTSASEAITVERDVRAALRLAALLPAAGLLIGLAVTVTVAVIEQLARGD